ncbi:LA2681 family HEPN domain-containing protein [Comamonas jiangduensis]|uniref:LA2681 family HEPN domain-containing protein n=1 Tax=Comamonas jiangduensis TaxID=1194168 RepID=UPI003BF7D6F6
MNKQITAHQLEKLHMRSIVNLDTAEALKHLGMFIDAGTDAGNPKSIDRALRQLEILDSRQLSDDHAVVTHYYKANAYGALAGIHHGKSNALTLRWNCTDTLKQMFHLNSAISHKGFDAQNPVLQCQILTNYGNLLKEVGRVIDAIAQWDRALSILPNFGKARGGRGLGLARYTSLQGEGLNKEILAQHAYDSLVSASKSDAFFESDDAEQANSYYQHFANQLAGYFLIDEIREQNYLDEGELGRTKAERAYRAWCLDNRLVLNPLNELGSWTAAAADVLTLPGLTVKISDKLNGARPPPIFGFFNQLKQEYASARFMLYEGITSNGVHFADRQVKIAETLDYSEFSLATERIRTAYRIAYSLLDKVAVLLNSYLGLGHEDTEKLKKLSFSNVWFSKKTSLLPQIQESQNIGLCGLYWLSRELHDGDLKLSTAADSRELHVIRNELEHKYLKVREGWAAPFIDKDAGDYAYTLGSNELEAKALRVMEIARSALLYLTFAIEHEELIKADSSSKALTVKMHVETMKSSRKRRDHF